MSLDLINYYLIDSGEINELYENIMKHNEIDYFLDNFYKISDKIILTLSKLNIEKKINYDEHYCNICNYFDFFLSNQKKISETDPEQFKMFSIQEINLNIYFINKYLNTLIIVAHNNKHDSNLIEEELNLIQEYIKDSLNGCL